ncbi:hypothetical protein Hanom_Chr04g00299881 [Helianthus anomalus]
MEEAARAREIIGLDTPFTRLFHTALEDSYREITDYVEDPDHVVHEITFRLAGQEFGMSPRDFAIHSGLYTEAELETDVYTQGIKALNMQTLISFWMAIARVPFGKSSQKATDTRDPCIDTSTI